MSRLSSIRLSAGMEKRLGIQVPTDKQYGRYDIENAMSISAN